MFTEATACSDHPLAFESEDRRTLRGKQQPRDVQRRKRRRLPHAVMR
jgi:hypothetical protein